MKKIIGFLSLCIVAVSFVGAAYANGNYKDFQQYRDRGQGASVEELQSQLEYEQKNNGNGHHMGGTSVGEIRHQLAQLDPPGKGNADVNVNVDIAAAPVLPKPAKGEWGKLEDGETVSGLVYRFVKKELRNRVTVEKVLAINKLTWEQAKKLPVGYEFFIPAEFLSLEWQLTLGGIANLKQEVKTLSGKVVDLEDQLAQKVAALNDSILANETLEGQLAESQDENIRLKASLKDAAAQVDKAKAMVESMAKDLAEKVSRIKWLETVLILIAIIAFVFFILFLVSLFRLLRSKKDRDEWRQDNENLRGYMRMGRLNFKFEDGSEYAFYCTITENNQYDIRPFNWNGETLIDKKDVAKSAVKNIVRDHLEGVKSVPEVEDALQSGRLVRLDRAEPDGAGIKA